uniref:Uncharacterized protein n=1 Tax=Rhizophora mucronata TaxID=61149 RepID=A0A2P2J4I0_RHIMU
MNDKHKKHLASPELKIFRTKLC